MYVSESDKIILRELGKRIAELAYLPVTTGNEKALEGK